MAFWDTVLNASPNREPAYGRRLLPSIIDNNANLCADHACFSIPRSTQLQQGFRNISWRMYANAINRTAHFIEKEIGRSSCFETVMYLGLPDVRVFIVLVALIKTGHKVLFTSYNCSLAAQLGLIKQTDCTILLYTGGNLIADVADIVESSRMESVCLPELHQLLSDSSVEPYPYAKTFEEAKLDPCFILSTSTPTGTVKPVIWTHWSISTTDRHHLVSPLEGRPTLWASVFDTRKRNYCGWPLYGAGICTGLLEACFNETTVVMGPPQPPTAEVFIDILEHGGIDAASCLPKVLETVARRPSVLEKLNKLKFIACVEGPLTLDAGDAISRHTTIYRLVGNAETYAMVQHANDREDWSYICLNPSYNGIEMRPRAGLFELVYVRESLCADYQGVFKLHPYLREFATKDLYSPHPTKPHLWKYEGRPDDSGLL